MNRLAAIALGLLLLLVAGLAHAQTVIRDTEIEETIRSIADPLFSAAGLSPAEVDIYVLNDDTLNAFVAGGQNLFINTGLLLRAETPDQLAGVVAHETGHIAGGHLIRMAGTISKSGTTAILGALLGAAAAVAGAPQLGTALLAGGLTLAQGNMLAFTRAQEQAADQAAVTYLASEKLPPTGLAEFFRILETQNLRITSDANAYYRTHPLTRDRIAFIDAQVDRSPYKGRKLGPEIDLAYARSKAKLDGFLKPPAQVLKRYSGDGEVARYARAMALRDTDLPKSVALIDGLIKERPKDPYYLELKGQILFEAGKIKDSVPPYREAMRYKPDSALIRIGLARALVETNDAAAAEEAATVLREATRLEPRNAGAWRTLGIAEGRIGNQGESSLALTEFAVLVRNKRDAEFYRRRAEQYIKPGDPSWVHLQDLKRVIEDMPNPREQQGRR